MVAHHGGSLLDGCAPCPKTRLCLLVLAPITQLDLGARNTACTLSDGCAQASGMHPLLHSFLIARINCLIQTGVAAVVHVCAPAACTGMPVHTTAAVLARSVR